MHTHPFGLSSCPWLPLLHATLLASSTHYAIPSLDQRDLAPSFLWGLPAEVSSRSPSAYTSPFVQSSQRLCSVFHPFGGGGSVIFIFHRRWDLATAESSQEHASSLLYIFLYLGCSGYWPGTVAETQFYTLLSLCLTGLTGKGQENIVLFSYHI